MPSTIPSVGSLFGAWVSSPPAPASPPPSTSSLGGGFLPTSPVDRFSPPERTVTAGPSRLPELSTALRGAARYGAVAGDLFVGGASIDDVMQGQVNDCFFLSSVLAVLAATPQALDGLLRDNGDGTVTARFFSGGGRTVEVTVDRQLPVDRSGQPAYGHARAPRELWVSLLEKAYAQWKGSYERLEGGSTEDALFELTGRPTTAFRDVSQVSADVLWRRMQEGSAKRQPMTAATWGADSGKPQLAEYRRVGLQDWHAYAVLGTSERGGQRTVVLRDPWGNKEAGADGRLDGRFELPFSDFVRLFKDVQVVA